MFVRALVHVMLQFVSLDCRSEMELNGTRRNFLIMNGGALALLVTSGTKPGYATLARLCGRKLGYDTWILPLAGLLK